MTPKDKQTSYAAFKNFLKETDTKNGDSICKILEKVKSGLGKARAQIFFKLKGGNYVLISKKCPLNSKFCAASMIKMSTAYIFLQVLIKTQVKPVEDICKLTIEELIPDFCQKHNLEEGIGKITVRDLLMLKSRLKNYPDILEKELVKRDIAPKEKFVIDENYKPTLGWNDSDYALMAMLSEELSKNSFANLFDDFIAKPLSLEHTSVPDQGKLSDLEFKSDLLFSNLIGAANLITTPKDFMKLQSFLSAELEKLMPSEMLYNLSTERYDKVVLMPGSYLNVPYSDKYARVALGTITDMYSLYFATDEFSIVFVCNNFEHRELILHELHKMLGIKKK